MSHHIGSLSCFFLALCWKVLPWIYWRGKGRKITVLFHGEGEVEVAGGVERDACGELGRPLCPRRRRLELDGRPPRDGAAGGRRRAAAVVPHRGKAAVRRNGQVVSSGGSHGGRSCGRRRAGDVVRPAAARRNGRELRGRAVHVCSIRLSLVFLR